MDFNAIADSRRIDNGKTMNEMTSEELCSEWEEALVIKSKIIMEVIEFVLKYREDKTAWENLVKKHSQHFI